MGKLHLIENLNENHYRYINYLVYSDKTDIEISKELGVSNVTLSHWKKSPVFQEALKKEMKNAFNALAIKAKNRLGKLIDSSNQTVALGACKEILSKAGYDAVQKIEQEIKSDCIQINIEDDD